MIPRLVSQRVAGGAPRPAPAFARRAFASSRRPAPESDSPHSLESPTHPGLYYHSLPSPPHPPNSYSLSFLDTPPPSLDFSPSTIGILSPADPASAANKGGPPDLLPRNFQENPDFRTLLNQVLQGAIKGDVWLETAAKVRGDGFM